MTIWSMVYGPATPFLDADGFLSSQYLPDSPRNSGKSTTRR